MTARLRGCLVALEGVDGCGKSTQAAILAERLDALLTFEPGATELGASLRKLLLDHDRVPITGRAEALLMVADRAQHVVEVIEPALDSGRWVVTDRFLASTLAYQGYGRDLERSGLEQLVGWATGGLTPDLTVLIDVPVDVAELRRGGSRVDRFEGQGGGFQQRVADGFLELAKQVATPWLVIDGTGSVEEVAAAVWDGVDRVVGGRRHPER